MNRPIKEAIGEERCATTVGKAAHISLRVPRVPLWRRAASGDVLAEQDRCSTPALSEIGSEPSVPLGAAAGPKVKNVGGQNILGRLRLLHTVLVVAWGRQSVLP